jgi:hypothetical protein
VGVPQQTGLQLASEQKQVDGSDEQLCSGSLQSVSAVALPEQHALAEVGSVSVPTQVQIPPLHRSVMHAWGSVHAAPVGSEGAVQAPASQ